jgi:hypothetical protein
VEQGERLADRDRPDASGFQVDAEALDLLCREIPQLEVAEAGEDVDVPEHRVELERDLRELRLGVESPPVLPELGEGLLAGVELAELACSLESADLGVEGLSVALAAEHLGAVPSALVAPAHTPDDPCLALQPLDAHPCPPWS